MKVIVSSKALANKLSKIDFSTDNVHSVVLIGDYLTINANTKSVEVRVVPSDATGSRFAIKQIDARWDWVRELVSKVSEQPIILDLHTNKVNVIFNY